MAPFFSDTDHLTFQIPACSPGGAEKKNEPRLTPFVQNGERTGSQIAKYCTRIYSWDYRLDATNGTRSNLAQTLLLGREAGVLGRDVRLC